MQPEFDPKTHRLVKIDLTIWEPTQQQIWGGPLHVCGKVVRRRRKRRTTKPVARAQDTAGDFLDMRFEFAALWMGGGAVKGVCSFSETEWHVLKALVEAGADGVEYGELIGTVPGWDVEYTDDGAVRRVLSKTNIKIKESLSPFLVTTRSREKGSKAVPNFLCLS